MDKTRSEMVARTCFVGPRLFAVIRDEPRTYKTGPRYSLATPYAEGFVLPVATQPEAG